MPWSTSARASDGNTYSFYRQNLTNQCGPASIATFINLTQSKQLDVSTIGEWHKEGEGVVSVGADNIRDFERNGSWYDGTIAALAKLNIRAHATKGFENAKKWITKTESQYKPAILSIGWYAANTTGGEDRNGGHWVVAVKVHGGNIICLDPGLDTGIVEIPVGTPGVYTVNYGTGAQTGKVDGIILK